MAPILTNKNEKLCSLQNGGGHCYVQPERAPVEGRKPPSSPFPPLPNKQLPLIAFRSGHRARQGVTRFDSARHLDLIFISTSRTADLPVTRPTSL